MNDFDRWDTTPNQDAEWSEIGRGSLLPGWWIVPGVAVCIALIGVVVWLIW